MNRFSAFIILLYTVWPVAGAKLTPEAELVAKNLDDDKWIWSYTQFTVPKNESQLNAKFEPFTLEPEPEFEVCKPYNPPLPEFKTPGRRLSEAKCDEYIWNIKVMMERKRRSKECTDKKFPKKHNVFYPATVGGRITTPGEFPHMGAIGWKASIGTWEFKCGSSLISSKFILTAGHCTRASDADTTLADPVPKIVRLSHKNIHLAGISVELAIDDINISKIIPHPKYKPPKKYYDIALMELEREVGFNQLVQPACLWGHRDISTLGSIATLTGWGVLKQGSLKISAELQAAVIDVLNEEVCDRLLHPACNRNWCGIQEHQLCAGKLAGGVDACQGDSGGPLQVKINMDFDSPYNMYHVIGVTSFGIGCAQPDTPGIYTRVSSFIDWIEEIVWA